MPDSRDFYIVAVTPRAGIYVDEASGFFYRTTTRDVLHAKRFESSIAAERTRRSTGGEVLHYILQPYGDVSDEVETLKAAVKQLTRERDEALAELEHYKKTMEED